ncbi:hypothetical protein Q3G72_034104 [Acer saccharum]|nr:hypothetical protein Q3G72_034104 [Acer saccharum]
MHNKDEKTKQKKIVIVRSATQVILDFLRIFDYGESFTSDPKRLILSSYGGERNRESFTSDPKRLILSMVKEIGKVFARNILLIVNFYLIALKSPQDPYELREEFGLPIHGAVTLPCDSTMFEYVVSLVGRQMPKELEKALLTSVATCHRLASSSSSSLAQGQIHQQQLIFGY